MKPQLFAGTFQLVRLIVRRDRWSLALWLAGLVGVTVAVTLAFPSLYPTEIEIQAILVTMENPAMIAMFGPAYGADNYHTGAVLSHQMLLFTALIAAIMAVMFMVRHTRRDEEAGRIEMIRSLPVGRLANVGAALLTYAAFCLVLWLLLAAALALSGVESLDWPGSLAYGGVTAVAALCFAAVTALVCQLTETSRGAVGLSLAILGFFYGLRGVGDVSSEPLALLSPLGLLLRAQVYIANFVWPVLVVLGLTIFVAVAALWLNGIRDLEAGIIPSRPGPAGASPRLNNPLALYAKLQRTLIWGWAAAALLLGASYGSIFGDVDLFLETNEMLQAMFASGGAFSMAEQFAAVLMVVMAVVSTIPALIIVLRVWGEERALRTEHLLARAVTRSSVLGSAVVLSLAVGTLVLGLSAVGLWAAVVVVMDEPLGLGSLLKGAAAYWPALVAMVALTTFLVGAVPRRSGWIWAYLGFSFFAVYMGRLLQLPEFVRGLTPFGHIPEVPVEPFHFGSFFVLLMISGIVIAAGFRSYLLRDIGR